MTFAWFVCVLCLSVCVLVYVWVHYGSYEIWHINCIIAFMLDFISVRLTIVMWLCRRLTALVYIYVRVYVCIHVCAFVLTVKLALVAFSSLKWICCEFAFVLALKLLVHTHTHKHTHSCALTFQRFPFAKRLTQRPSTIWTSISCIG